MATDVGTLQPGLFPFEVRLEPAGPDAPYEKAARDAFGLGDVRLAPTPDGHVLRFVDGGHVWAVVCTEGVHGLERRLREGFAAWARQARGAGGRAVLVRAWDGAVVAEARLT